MPKKIGPPAQGPRRTMPKPKPKPVNTVTDHAVLRYLERVMGLDVEAIRETMLTEENKAWISQFRDGKFPIGGGHFAKAVNGVVVTIL